MQKTSLQTHNIEPPCYCVYNATDGNININAKLERQSFIFMTVTGSACTFTHTYCRNLQHMHRKINLEGKNRFSLGWIAVYMSC